MICDGDCVLTSPINHLDHFIQDKERSLEKVLGVFISADHAHTCKLASSTNVSTARAYVSRHR